jgi:Cu+-exporting ATPase
VARVGETTVLVGSRRFLEDAGIEQHDLDARAAGGAGGAGTGLRAPPGGRAAGAIALFDRPKDHARAAVRELTRKGLAVYLVSGDHPETVRAVADLVGVTRDHAFGNVSPEAKAAQLAALRAGKTRVAMVGDGLNDAPALAAADVGIALGTGTDLAMAAADVVIATGDLRAVPKALTLGRATLRAIRQNLFWAFAYNTVGIPLAAVGLFGTYGPLIAALAMSLSSVTVVLRSSLLAGLRLD